MAGSEDVERETRLRLVKAMLDTVAGAREAAKVTRGLTRHLRNAIVRKQLAQIMYLRRN